MFDITTAREVVYGDGQVTYAYQDHDDPNTWYLVPSPRIRTMGGDPVFSVIEYTENGGGVSGACTFEADLVQPEAAKAALEAELGKTVTWGGFTWVGGNAYFHFLRDGAPEILVAEPSLYGTNVVSFQVELETAEQLNEFKTALSQGGGNSPFSIEYDMQVLTKLLGAKATVSYNSQAAITYEERYRTEKDTWGRQKRVLEEVKQVLQQSGAGDVHVEIGAGGTPELEQRVRDWAWTTLEDQVASTVAAAATMATAPGNNPVSATTSFTKSYTEDTVVDWSTPVSSAVPVFTTETWENKVLQKVDNRKLSVIFSLVGQLTSSETGLAIAERVTVTVDYPTRQTDNTFELIPADGDKSTLIYEAPGEFTPTGEFVPDFKFSFVIRYSDGTEYTSAKISTIDTVVNIAPSDFGTRQVTFVGQGVPFGDDQKDVDRVVIDLFFTPPFGQTAIVQTKDLTANGNAEGDPVQFNSYYKQPIGGTYHYTLRYMMNDGSVISSGTPITISSAPENTNSGNADIVYVIDPANFTTQFNLRVFNVSNAPSVLLADISAQYFDQENSPGRALFHNAWPNWEPGTSPAIVSADPWTFAAVDNTNSAYFKLAGNIYFSDGTEVDLGTSYQQPSGNRTFLIRTDSQPYGVRIITSEIDWDQVAGVNLTFFRLEGTGADKLAGKPPAFFAMPRVSMTTEQLAIAEGSQADLYAYSLMKATDGQPVDNLDRFYALKRPHDQPNVEFYYTAEYIMAADSERRWLKDQHVEGVLTVTLPDVPPAGSNEPGFVRHTVDADTLKALEKEDG